MVEKMLSMLEVTVNIKGSDMVFKLLFIVIGFALIVWGIINLVTRFKKKKTFILTDGKVVDYVVRRDSDGVATYGIIAEYEVDGVSYTIEPHFYSTGTKRKHPIGSLVKVCYNPEDPADSIYEIDSNSIMVLIGGIIFMAFGIFMMLK